MPEDRLNYHCSEIQDLMGRIPGWTIRWGLFVISLIFVGVCIACYFIKYPQVVTTQVQLTSYNPPVDLIARTSNKIARLFVSNGDSIQADASILVMESKASYEDIMEIDKDILNFTGEWEELVQNEKVYRNYKLGDIQNYFLQYQKKCAAFRNYLQTSLLKKKKAILEVQIAKQTELFYQQGEQLKLLAEEFQLLLKNYARDSLMLNVGGMAQAEYEKSTQAILQKKSALIGFRANMISTETSVLALKENLVEVEIQMETEINGYHIELNELREQLKSQIDSWKNDYLIVSPIAGEVSISKFWSEHQNITASEKVATVVPFEDRYIIGKAYVPFSGYAKISAGQKVNVRLDSYPYMEYGFIIGTVNSVSPVPEQEGYAIEIIFPDQLISSYGKKLDFIHQMTGSADIITRDMRLAEQFIQPVRAVWDQIRP